MLQFYNKLLNNKEFKSWKDKHKDAYLSSCVLMSDPGQKEIWNFDFYIPKKNKITTFSVDEKLEIKEDQKIFEQNHKKLKEINLEKIKFNLNDVNKLIDKEFKNIKILKKIIILQYIETLLWNVSLLGTDFNLHNVRIDVENGKTLDKSSTSLLQFKAS
ncbi:MAG: hypothetical protein AABW56_02780 [Nanoarchaeota archaeon]